MQNGIYTVNTRAANNAKVTKLGRKNEMNLDTHKQ